MKIVITNIILTLILVLIFCIAIFYVIKSFKSGKKCIGCPEGCSCGSKNKQIENIDDNCCDFGPVNTCIKVQCTQKHNCSNCNSCKNNK